MGIREENYLSKMPEKNTLKLRIFVKKKEFLMPTTREKKIEKNYPNGL